MRNWIMWTLDVAAVVVQGLVASVVIAAAVIGVAAVALPWIDTLSF